MVAYNFKPQFAPLVESGQKCQTIRALSRRRHAEPGEKIQLYTGMRTKNCRKLINPDPVCIEAQPIRITSDNYGLYVEINGGFLPTPEIEELAAADGFQNVASFYDFFRDRMPFEGVLIKWDYPQEVLSDD